MLAAALVRNERSGDRFPNVRATLGLSAYPDTELQNDLKLIRKIVPAIVVAECVSRQVVLDCLATATAVGKHMISLPAFARSDGTSANVAELTGPCEDTAALALAEHGARAAPSKDALW